MNTQKVDWFIGTVFAGEAEVSDEMFQTLVDHAVTYLKATGAISWAEWQCLNPRSKQAFEKAGEFIDEIRCEKIASLLAQKLRSGLEGLIADRFREKEVGG